MKNPIQITKLPLMVVVNRITKHSKEAKIRKNVKISTINKIIAHIALIARLFLNMIYLRIYFGLLLII